MLLKFTFPSSPISTINSALILLYPSGAFVSFRIYLPIFISLNSAIPSLTVTTFLTTFGSVPSLEVNS